MQRKELLEKCKAVGKVAGKSSLPILGCILIAQDKPGRLSLTATDLATYITGYLPGEINEPICVPAKLLVKALSSQKSEPVGLMVGKDADDPHLTIVTDRASVTIEGYDPADWPLCPDTNMVDVAELDGGILSQVLGRALKSASTDTDSSRPMLTGILCESAEGILRFVSTDTHRLNVEIYPDAAVNPFNAVIPGDVATLAAGLMNNSDVTISSDRDGEEYASRVCLRSSDYTITARCIEGKYPNWRKVIPEQFNTTVQTSQPAFLQAIDAVAFVAADNSHRAQLRMKEGNLHVEAECCAMKAAADCSAEITREPEADYSVVFNATYMRQILSCIDKGASVTVSLAGEMNPSRWESPALPGWQAVLMPMQPE